MGSGNEIGYVCPLKRTTAHAFHVMLALSRKGADVSERVLPLSENVKSTVVRKEKYITIPAKGMAKEPRISNI